MSTAVDLRVGGRILDRGAATAYARTYLTERRGWAYPSYDGYDAAHALGPLNDADLLAPLLLNVHRISLTTYEALQAIRPRLQQLLDQLPVELDLLRAEAEHLEVIAQLFAVLDDPGLHGAPGTVLAKLLHRKRPALVPLYHKSVGLVYQEPPGPVPYVQGRSWHDFMLVFLPAVQEDLRHELPLWRAIAATATGPRITPLRALDIVAW